MSVTNQLMPPSSGVTVTTVVNGRKYSAAAGAVVTAPDFDATVLEANGWIIIANGGTGATAGRPVNPPKSTHFHDSTLGKNIIWDGKTWRDPDSGTAV